MLPPLTMLYIESAKRYALWTGIMHRFINASHHRVWLGSVGIEIKPLKEIGFPRDHHSVAVTITFNGKEVRCEMPVIKYAYELDTADASIEILNDIVEFLESYIHQQRGLSEIDIGDDTWF